jgi:hypothetical protein
MPTLRKGKVRKHHIFGLRPWTRHSIILLVAGVMYIAFGVSLMKTKLTFAREVGIDIALQWFSITTWGLIWIAVGLMAILSSRWPPALERWGYMALTGFTAGWASIYLLSIIFGESPLANLSFVFVWSMVAFMWWGVSGLLNPDHTGVSSRG